MSSVNEFNPFLYVQTQGGDEVGAETVDADNSVREEVRAAVVQGI